MYLAYMALYYIASADSNCTCTCAVLPMMAFVMEAKNPELFDFKKSRYAFKYLRVCVYIHVCNS